VSAQIAWAKNFSPEHETTITSSLINMNKITIGILGLQGAFHKHQQLLERLSVGTAIIRYPEQIKQCDGLIIPGGESTTMTKLIRQMELFEPIKNFDKPIFGTCAGAILLSVDANDSQIDTFGKIPVSTRRNAYGRQVESFKENICIKGFESDFPAVFIRAPKFTDIDSSVEILSSLNGEPILLQYKNILLSSFHPELTSDTRIHELWLKNMSV
jgi:5'-phosphate synthase pdxT subunit